MGGAWCVAYGGERWVCVVYTGRVRTRHYIGKNKLSAFKAAGVRALVSDMHDALFGVKILHLILE